MGIGLANEECDDASQRCGVPQILCHSPVGTTQKYLEVWRRKWCVGQHRAEDVSVLISTKCDSQ